jgi:hypothetical protein
MNGQSKHAISVEPHGLPEIPRLPTLMTDAVLVGHNRKADLVFTEPQWFELCVLMHNDNPQNFFLMPYLKNGEPKYSKAFKACAKKRMRWSYHTICGTAKMPASIGFYPTNENRRSRWGAIDIDARDGDAKRARDIAFNAFQCLYHQPQLYIVLCTSGSDGWHIFVFTAEFHDRAEWTRLLKQVAALIGVTVRKGEFEIFPDDSRGIGHGIRAPGTLNFKTGQFDLIRHETVTKLLGSGKENNTSLSALGELPGKKTSGSTNSEKKGLFRGIHGEWKSRFAITAPRSRHEQLSKLVGTAFYQASHDVALKNARLQYDEAVPRPETPLDEHAAEAGELWSGMERKWLAELSNPERLKFDALSTATEREAFRIIRNWSRADSPDPDFFIVCEGLAWRIGLSIRGAGKLRSRFCSLGILRETAAYVPHKWAARFKWLANKNERTEIGAKK